MFFDGGREKRAVSLAGKKKARPNPQETAQKSAQAKLQRVRNAVTLYNSNSIRRSVILIIRITGIRNEAPASSICGAALLPAMGRPMPPAGGGEDSLRRVYGPVL